MWAWAVSWDGRKVRTQVVEEGGDDEWWGWRCDVFMFVVIVVNEELEQG